MGHEEHEPRRFRANVPYYVRYRLPYPDALIGRIAECAGLEPGDAILDLGSGPGLLAIPFARAAMTVTAVDPEPDMLEALRAEADRAGVKLDIREGSSFEMPRGIGPFRLVTIGRAFHWMDRTATLEELDGLIGEGGAIALVHDDHPATVENTWRSALRDLADRFGRSEAPHIRASRSEGYRTHESVLLDSAFARLDRIGIVVRRTLTADDIVGLAFSLSVCSPERLGTSTHAFETELRGELARLSADGHFTEIAELSALIARRE